jgi:hypothetical protein
VFLLVVVYRGGDGIARADHQPVPSYTAAEALIANFTHAFPGCLLIAAIIVPVTL